MKKISLFLLIFVFLVVSAFAGELIIGGGFFNMGPGGGGGGAEYEMDASGGSIILTGLTGQSFTFSGTTRTYIDSAGVMQDAAINTPRVEADGLLLEPAGANICLQSRNFDTSPWAAGSGGSATQDETGVDGQANKAWTHEDDRGSAYEQIYYLNWPISANNPTVIGSLFVKKDSITDRFPEFRIQWTGGIGKTFAAQINTSTGATNIRINDTANGVIEVVDTGTWWRIFLTDTDTGSNTSFSLHIFPAAGNTLGDYSTSAQGTIVVDAVQLEPDVLTPSSYIDNDGVAAGSDLATDGDCSGGTLSMGTGWTHDAGNDEYDATASTANLSEGAILTVGKLYRIKTVWGNITGGSVQIRVGGAPVPGLITADGTYYHYAVAASTVFAVDGATAFTGSLQEYEVLEFGTARETEAGALTYDLPSDLFAETLGSDLFDAYKGVFTLTDLRLSELSSGNLSIDTIYEISARTEQDFTLDGAPDNNVGTTFRAASTNVTLDADDKVYPIDISWGQSSGQFAIDSDTLKMTGAAGGYLYLRDSYDLSSDLTVGELYKITFDTKVGAGDSVNISVYYDGTDYGETAITGTSFSSYSIYFVAQHATNHFLRVYNQGAAEEFWIDNIVLKQVTNAVDSGDGLAPPHGTAIVWWRPGYNKNESVTNYIIRLDNGAFFYHSGNGFPRTSDGVVEIETALTFAKNTDYKIIIKWGYLASNVAKFRIGYDSGSGVTWGTETDFDGGYITGTTLDFATTLNNLHHNKRTQIYEQILSDAEIDATPAP